MPPTATVPPPTAIPPTATRISPTVTAVPPTVPAPPTLAVATTALGADLDAMFQKLAKDGTFSGSALVAQNGQILLSQGYGLADRDKNLSNTSRTKFRIVSLTKAFTAMAILILQEQGKLKVQDSLCVHLKDCPDAWKPVTLHHLLTHTSGIHEPGLWPK
jgi:CubicO group peptidase (beta-lactamase class C family)